MISKTFHAFLALLVAIPFGAGGLCCCLFDSRPAPAATPVSSCCGGENVPVERSSCPERDGDGCECPVRDAALLAKVAPEIGALPETPVAVAPALSGALAGEIHAPYAGPRLRRNLHAPPKAPIYRTLCAILC